MRPIIYLSGPIKNNKNYKDDFSYWEKYFLDKGYMVVNPIKIDHEVPDNRLETLLEDFEAMMECNMVLFMRGWQEAGGCLAEWGYAINRHMIFLYEGYDRHVSFDMPSKNSWMDTDIIELELSVRSYNCLKRSYINTVGDLISRAEENKHWAIGIRNLGRRSYEEIRNSVKEKTGVDV